MRCPRSADKNTPFGKAGARNRAGAAAVNTGMKPSLLGVHHVTAIAGDPQRNLDFYSGLLGLRLVKRTVNFDDPATYHLYYGDGLGRPGTILTFFPWPGAAAGRVGTGQQTGTALSVPPASFPFWQARLTAAGVASALAPDRFGQPVLSFADPDGLPLELVEAGDDARPGWPGGPVPADFAVRGVHHVTLASLNPARTRALLTGIMGTRAVSEDAGRMRYAFGDAGSGAYADLLLNPAGMMGKGLMGAGTIHHVAWRTPDDAQQQAWQDALAEHELSVSPVMDRQYFHSIYYHEPGGILFEIATDPPGFTADEGEDELGASLKLPDTLEPHRAEIERLLPLLRAPA